MISLLGIFRPKMDPLVKSKHVCGSRDPLPAKLSVDADLSVLYGFGSCGCWTWQCMCDLPMWPGWLSSHWYASAIPLVNWALYLWLQTQEG